jgi:hypothetical protein
VWWRPVEAERFIEGGNGFRRGTLAEDRFCETTRQHFECRKDNDRHREQRQQPQPQTLQHGQDHRMHWQTPQFFSGLLSVPSTKC